MNNDEYFFYLVCNELYSEVESPEGKSLSDAISDALEKQRRLPKERRINEVHVTTVLKNRVRGRLDAYVKIINKKIIKEKNNKTIGGEGVFYVNSDKLERYSETVRFRRGTTPRFVILKKPEIPVPTEAELALAVALKHADFFLPKNERDALSKKYEDNMNVKNWLGKIDVVPRYITLIPNHSGKQFETNQELIMKALVNERGFKANYLKRTEEIFFPFKLVRRERVSYVYCYNNKTIREYAISRFEKISEELIDREWETPDQESLLNTPVESKIRGNWGLLDELIIRIEGAPAQHFTEMRFHKDPKDAQLTTIDKSSLQNEDRSKDFVEIKIRNIQYSYEFKCWLLGLGCQVIIVSFKTNADKVNPIRDLKEEAKKILSFYKATE